MKINEEPPFTWYAEHERDGDLTMLVKPERSYKFGFIYSPKMIIERLKSRGRRLTDYEILELNMGPLGFIDRRLYNEAGFTFLTPFRIRMTIITYVHIPDHTEAQSIEFLEKHDQELTETMLRVWNSPEQHIRCT